MTSPSIISDVAELKSRVGERFGPSDWTQVTQAQIQAFADATGDDQWIHTDVERAKRESPFEGPIAHGYLTIALAPVLLPTILKIENCRMAVNYGIDKMRLPAPVPAGARLRMSVELRKVRMLPSGAARTTLGLHFEVEGSAKAACTADAVYVYFP